MLSDLKLSRNTYLFASIFFSVYVFILDYFLNLQISLGLSYALIMIFTLFQEGKKPVFNTAIFLSILVAIGAIFSIGDLSPTLIFINRVVDITLIWFAGFLILKFKKLESEKEEKERQFEETLDKAPTAIYISRRFDSMILYANQASKKFNGYDQHEILNKKGTDIYVDPTDRERILKAIDKNGSVDNYEMQIRRNDGKILTILTSVKAIRFKNEDAIISVNADITYQKQVEKRFRQLLESTPDSIFIINEKGDIVLANAKAKSLFKSDPVDITGINIDNILPGYKEKIISTDRKESDDPEMVHQGFEVNAIKNDGSEFPAEVTTSVLNTEEGFLFAVAVRDITERKIDQLQIEFYNRISKIIGNAESFDKALYLTLEEICTTLDWDYGEIWLPDASQKTLGFGPVYYHNNEKIDPFVTGSKEFLFEKGKGLCGIVWRDKKPYWVEDLATLDEDSFPRSHLASSAGLRSSIGVPVFDKNEIVAIIVLYDFEKQQKREDLIRIISSVTAQIGSLFIKKQAEDALKASEKQLENTLISAPIAILISSLQSEKVIFANKEALRLLSVPEDVVLSTDPPDFYYSEEDKVNLRQKFSEQGYIENAEIRLRRYDKKVIDVLVSIKTMKFRNEDVAVIAFSDITSQKKTEKKFRDLLESAPDAIMMLDQEGKIVVVNDQTEKFFGYSKAELINKSSGILIPERHKSRFEAFINAKFKHPETIVAGETYESKGCKKDNSEIPVEINLGTIDTEDGLLISAVIRDISDRQTAQEELHKKHNQLLEAQAVAHIGSWEWNLENNDLNWSDELYRIYGLSQEEINITYEIFTEKIHPDDQDYVNLIIQKAIEDHQPFNFYHRIIRDNDEIRILNSRGKVIVKNKKPIKLLGTGMDVTDLKLAEEKIKESEEKFRYFVETSNDLIWSLDKEYRWNYLNPQACIEIYGYTPDEMIGKKYSDFKINKINDENSFLNRLFEQGAIFHHETIHRRKDGKPVCLKFNGVLLKDTKGEIIGATGTATDISELKQAEGNLRQTESALRSLHDITTGEDTLDTDEKIDALLKLGCKRFEMEDAYLIQIIEDEPKVIAHTSTKDDEIINDLVLEMEFHRNTIKEKEPILIREIGKSEFKDSKIFQTHNIHSFITEKIYIGGIIFGTICFISATKRSNEFNPTDSEIIKLMAQWVGGVIQREQVKQNLMNAIVETEEQERKRFAEDLHDSLGQILSAAKLNLSAMESKVKEMGNGMIDFYENSKSLVDYAMQEAKAISQNLMPAALENYGLEKTIQTLCEKISYTNKVKINFHSFNMTNRFKSNIEIGIYRIAQELINNAVKHSNAEEINIQLIQHKKSILLMVEDDGIGFEENRDTITAGMGLKNVQTRVRSLHGTFSIDTSPGNGTIATVEIPLND